MLPGKPSFSLLFILVLGFLLPAGLFAQVPEDYCVSQQEYALYRKINAHRSADSLQVIPISRSLSYVARLHVKDLFENHPDTSYCNLNSWSDKGPWTPCCHSKYKPMPECILNKPGEITAYPGQAHELCYYDSYVIHVDTVFNFWMKVEQAKNILTNNKRWGFYTWQAMGVGIYKNYACVWLGEEKDPEPEPVICQEDSAVEDLEIPEKKEESKVVENPTGRFYIIFGSYTNLEDAMQALEKYRKEGFNHSKVMIREESFRVSLSDHAGMQEARDAKSKLGTEYREAWIVKY